MRKLGFLTFVRPVALVLVFLLPAQAMAQSTAAPQKSSSKWKWIALGSIAAGVGAALVATASKTDATTQSSSNCPAIPPGTIGSCATVATVGAIPTVVLVPSAPGTPPSPSATRTNPGTMSAVPMSTISLATLQERRTNWKMLIPSVGVASAGAFVLYRDHTRKKKAELSLRNDGAAQFQFKW